MGRLITYNNRKFSLPEEWQLLLPAEVLDLKLTLKAFHAKLGLFSYAFFLRLLKQDSEFCKWFSLKGQMQAKFADKEFKEMKCLETIRRNSVCNPFNNQETRGKVSYFMSDPTKVASRTLKFKATCESRYGTYRVNNLQQFKDKSKSTSLLKYGVEHPSQSALVRNKIRETYIRKYGANSHTQYPENVLAEILDLSGIKAHPFIGMSDGRSLRGVCSSCGREFEFHFITAYVGNYSRRPTKCPYCKLHGTTKLQTELLVLLNGLGIVCNSSKAVLGNGQEIDIYIPDLKIGFEVNGAFSHNSGYSYYGDVPKDKYYHRDKTDLADDHEIKLYHLWEHWPREVVEDLLITRVSPELSTKLGASRLTLAVVSKEDERMFLSRFHTLGYARSSFCLGLYNGSVLIYLMSLKRCKEGIELLRNCIRPGYSVVGGFSRLLSHSLDWCIRNKVSRIITYADRDLTPDPLSSVYARHGFQYLGDSGPTLSYYVFGRCSALRDLGFHRDQVISRFHFQKHRLPALFVKAGIEFIPEESEISNLLRLSVAPLYNSGCHKFEYIL